MKPALFRTPEDIWNTVFMLVFLVLVFTVSAFLDRNTFVQMSIWDLFIISIASFRLIRLATYDKITAFIRDYFAASDHPFKQTISELLICPWCTGIWAALFCVSIYFLFPAAWLFFVILAVAGIASFLQIIVNAVIRYSEKTIAEKEKIEKEIERGSSKWFSR